MYCSETGSSQVNPIESLGFPCGRNPINSHLSCSFGSLKQFKAFRFHGEEVSHSACSAKGVCLSIILKMSSKLSSQKSPCQLQVGSFCFEMPPKALGFSRLPQPWKAAVHRMLSGCLVHKECSNRWMNHTHTAHSGEMDMSNSPCVPSIVAFLIMTSHLCCPCNLAN